MYYFISGYTSKVAGTERGITEPQATFSACFGAPFLPLHPIVYADLLKKRILEHDAKVWLINTGWTGGPYGEGKRIDLPHTRAMVHAILNGSLGDVDYTELQPFGLNVPDTVSGVPDKILVPRQTWADPEAYNAKAHHLVQLFNANFEQFKDRVPEEVVTAGPSL